MERHEGIGAASLLNDGAAKQLPRAPLGLKSDLKNVCGGHCAKECGGHCKIFVVAIVQFSFVVATAQGVSPEVRDMPPPWAPKPSRKKKDLRVFWDP